ncbi:cyclin-C-like [Oscarella lobularis]|uniref:cyclin-C-like n=1 Tax=Oscarella lobularis TaxID=121494 RepID=UPI003313D04F
MAGNFWHSSHCNQWLLEKDDLVLGRQTDLIFLTEDEILKMHIFFANFIQALAECLKQRQQVIATSTIYFKRFYTNNSFGSIDPLLMAPTCIYLAAKVEESGLISNTRLVQSCQSIVKTKFSYALKDFPYRMPQILECEFYLLEMMDCCLITFNPYRSLTQYVSDIGQEDSLLSLAWRIVNDTYRSDTCLLYPPYLIALAALHMACVVNQKDCKQWFAELSVDMEKVLQVTQEILLFYKLWKSYDETKEIRAILAKAPKPRLSSGKMPKPSAGRSDSPASRTSIGGTTHN